MKKNAFTFLETLVVIAIFSLIFPLVLSILFIILQQQLRVFSLSEVKRQGDAIVNYLTTTISNNAHTLYDIDRNEVCGANNVSYPVFGVPVFFRDRYNSEFSLIYNGPDLLIEYDIPSVPAPTFVFAKGQLNNSRVRLSSFSIDCQRLLPFSAPLVSINFTICYNISGTSCASTEPQKVVSLDYRSNIKLRSFPTE
ncbi:hypothetical protein A2767_04340 [Candidatus Roizmanbacteria bacterium RIFCSPHIGHO2_01_FULL_35_10]|uniref:Type II secretion system protein n=1 Tax=Candidatus Roizmanbacteria bacterium RIFCSPLOWO2_01_FULL_35_13 TaxID=1802055 RepID=A0A1F7I8H6_9BACT|nr:MAG: hypothetical protein A2767_04340 [Candidatus Roizmanbacteria bacterium RIFCSPHIGHO2_01_FULL_35_10]OGK39658.1 MAG: hypothetical protein A3A74_07785 [Candidatus Roizmanbacteria bacterium RIFCSPLOWO2_01_FULL_35_13]